MFGNQGTVFQSIIDTDNRIIFHRQEKTARELLATRPCIKQSGSCVSKVMIGHQPIIFKCVFQIVPMNR